MSKLNGSFGQADGLVGTLGTDKSLTGYLVGGYGLSLTGQLGGSLIPGPKGDKGDKGDRGDTGATGPIGPAGPQGDQGPQGETGPKGDKGDTGERGETGATGPMGPQGDRGTQGEVGPKGDKGDRGDIGPQGLKGDKGDKGDPGDDYILTQQDMEDIAGLVDIPVEDVQINGTSILQDGVANIPYITSAKNYGLTKLARNASASGLWADDREGILYVATASVLAIKDGTNRFAPITPIRSDASAFYGLAKVAGHDEKDSTLPVGTYTEEAKSAISDMFNAPVTVDGTTPVINAKSGVRYVCGECSTIDISTPESGIIDVTFVSGSTPTVLTVTPPEGMTMVWANNFDPTDLDANTTYEINIMDGCKGVACSWT